MRASSAASGVSSGAAPTDGNVAGMLAKPWIRATSSTRSIPRSTSRRWLTAGTDHPEVSEDGSNPSADKIPSTSASSSWIPRCLRMSARSSLIGLSSGCCGKQSTCPGKTCPGPVRASRAAMRSAACGAVFQSAPRSKRWDASVNSLKRRAAFRMTLGRNQAASSSTLRVSAVISVACPPITPASATGLSASQIARCPPVRSRSSPSRVTSFSPLRARRTMMAAPASLSRSKACVGWPISSRT